VETAEGETGGEAVGAVVAMTVEDSAAVQRVQPDGQGGGSHRITLLTLSSVYEWW
jgi:hypothetical protein